MKLLRVRFTVRGMMAAVAIVAIGVAAPSQLGRHHIRAEERHELEASRLHEELQRSPEYMEQQRLKNMWANRANVPLTEPNYKFEMSYSLNLSVEYNRRFGDKVRYHHAQAKRHRLAAATPWIPTWLD